jgi:hypothetical protein
MVRQLALPLNTNLVNRIAAEADPNRQIALLREWESLYPQTDFQRERLALFASAFHRSGKPAEAFTCALDLLNFDPADTGTLLLIATIGPSLPSPSEKQIAATEAAAVHLLSPRPRPVKPSPELPASKDPEAERVGSLIRQMRRDAPAPIDPAIRQRRAAESALAWVSRVKR